MKNPRFSIVTISFNQKDYLEECINSVLNQNFKNYEYIIVDDGSTDGSREIILKYKDKLKFIFGKNDYGPTNSLNKGFEKAKGEIFYYINSDDFMLQNALTDANKIFQDFPESDVIYGNGYEVDQKSFLKRRIFATKFNLYNWKYNRLRFFQQGNFIKKNVFWEVGGFNLNNNKNWDTEIFLDIYCKTKNFKKVNNFFGAFRIYPGTISSNPNAKNLQKNRMFEKFFKRKINIFDKILIILFYFFDRAFNIIFLFRFISDKINSKRKIKIY